MKKTTKIIILSVLLVVFMAGAVVLYNNLSKNYPSSPPVQTTQGNAQVTEEITQEKIETTQQKLYEAPDFTVTDKDGNEVKLSDFEGKPVVLNFWATWCYYCKVEMPDFNRAYENYPDVQFLMVNATDNMRETVDKAQGYIDDEGFDFPVFYDISRDAVYTYNITSYPTTLFIDANGNIVTYRSGMLNYERLVSAIELII